jgi:macrolide transport system ATP-binding/permease protein
VSVVRARDIRFSYRLEGADVPVLHGIDLDIGEGELVAIQGPSGSGKSTLLYILGCLLKPTAGELAIRDVDVSRLHGAELAGLRSQRIGFVFQHYHLLPRATVLENILLPAEYPIGNMALQRGDAVSRATQLAQFLGIDERLSHFPNQLSGGQQQRVAIARALMNDPDVILADEPTGSLDSKSSREIIALLQELRARGKTIIVITHDSEVAQACQVIYRIRDGRIQSRDETAAAGPGSIRPSAPLPPLPASRRRVSAILPGLPARFGALARLGYQSLRRHKIRSALTMLGVTIGIASVFSMVSLGGFAKKKILDSYANLGINTVLFGGTPNRFLKAVDRVPQVFTEFHWDRDIALWGRMFPQIVRISPLLPWHNGTAVFAGRRLDDIMVLGVNEHGLGILGRDLTSGRNFSRVDMERRNPVCLVSRQVEKELLQGRPAVGQVVQIVHPQVPFTCRVVGVIADPGGGRAGRESKMQVWSPYLRLQSVANLSQRALIREVLMEVQPGTDVARLESAMKNMLESKYGTSAHFRANAETQIIGQMKKFLNVFTALLGVVAFISLGVGGIGITNMMLVSVGERIREIGIRKALGATDAGIRLQLLIESMLICAIAGAAGILAGFGMCEATVYFGSLFIPSLDFEVFFDKAAFALASVSIISIGIVSGVGPALKAESLHVIEALRTE